LNLREIEEGLAVRATLEGLACREAYAKITSKERMDMGRALQGMKEAAQTRDGDKFFKAHKRFHEIFINASGNHLLIRLLNVPRIHRLWYPSADDYHMPTVEQSIESHQKIWEMFMDPHTNPNELALLVRGYIEAARKRLFFLMGGDSKKENQPGYALQ